LKQRVCADCGAVQETEILIRRNLLERLDDGSRWIGWRGEDFQHL